jgi:hypothetical protein
MTHCGLITSKFISHDKGILYNRNPFRILPFRSFNERFEKKIGIRGALTVRRDKKNVTNGFVKIL